MLCFSASLRFPHLTRTERQAYKISVRTRTTIRPDLDPYMMRHSLAPVCFVPAGLPEFHWRRLTVHHDRFASAGGPAASGGARLRQQRLSAVSGPKAMAVCRRTKGQASSHALAQQMHPSRRETGTAGVIRRNRSADPPSAMRSSQATGLRGGVSLLAAFSARPVGVDVLPLPP